MNVIQRSALTNALLAQLGSTDLVIGDGEMPRSVDGQATAGWVGRPDAAGTNFIPYSVVTSIGSPASSGGPLGEPGSDVWFAYAVTSYGVSRRQAEDQADAARFLAQQLRKETVPMWTGTAQESGRRIQAVVIQSYGTVQPTGATDPRTYALSDTLALWTTG